MEEVLVNKNPFKDIYITISLQDKSTLQHYTNPQRYGLDKFDLLVRDIPDDKWHLSTISYKNEELLDITKRSSKKCTCISIHKLPPYFCDDYDDYETFKKFNLDLKYTSFDKNNFNNEISNFQLLKYDINDHFNEFHYDKHQDNIIGTALLFPPAHISSFTGGDLVFKKVEDDQESFYTIHPSKFTEWTLITFGHILHKCTPVESGTRYVFKGDIISHIKLSPINMSLIGITDLLQYSLDHCDDRRITIKQKIESLLADLQIDLQYGLELDLDKYISKCKIVKPTLEKLQNEYIESNSFHNTDIHLPEDINYKVIIYVCDTKYEQPYDYNTFKINHLKMIKAIVKSEKKYKFALFNKQFEYYIPYDKFCHPDDYLGSRLLQYDSGDKNIYKWIFQNDTEIGELYDKQSEYNDESGYNITNCYVSTCIAYWI